MPVVLQSNNGAITWQYLYALGTRPLAQYGTSWEYLLPEALGSVRQIVNANGNLTLAKFYEPYGTVLTSSGPSNSIFAYAGEQADPTGLMYLRARYLNPALGIFLARDPVSGDVMKPGSMNGYSYVEGNPVNRVDPSGLWWWGAGQALWDASEELGHNQNVHVRIQALMMILYGTESVHAEYKTISGLPVDLLNSVTGEMWEIKPWADRAGAFAVLVPRLFDMESARQYKLLKGKNPYGMPYDWNDSPPSWSPGNMTFPPGDIYIGSDLTGQNDFYAAQIKPGVIAWWRYQRPQPRLVPYPIVLPQEMYESPRNRRTNWQPAFAQSTPGCVVSTVPPGTQTDLTGVGVGVSIGVLIWWLGKALSPVCGPLAPACAVAF